MRRPMMESSYLAAFSRAYQRRGRRGHAAQIADAALGEVVQRRGTHAVLMDE